LRDISAVRVITAIDEQNDRKLEHLIAPWKQCDIKAITIKLC